MNRAAGGRLVGHPFTQLCSNPHREIHEFANAHDQRAPAFTQLTKLRSHPCYALIHRLIIG
ncbi:hypothetical protein D3C81_2232130 [compost metagenome]